VGENPGGKAGRAAELALPVMNEEEFNDWLTTIRRGDRPS